MKKLTDIDVFKAFATIMVVLVHVTATPVVTLGPGMTTILLTTINRFVRPCVPMFLFASGVAMQYIYKDKEFKYCSFIGKRSKKIIIPYLIWSLIYYYVVFIKMGQIPFDFKFLVTGILTGKMMYHLYYIVIAIQFYILFGMIRYVVQKYNAKYVLAVTLVINIICVYVLPYYVNDRLFTTYLIYFVLGCCVGKNLEAAKSYVAKHIILVGGVFAAFIAVNSYSFYSVQVLKAGFSFFRWDQILYLGLCLSGILFLYYIAEIVAEKTQIIKKAMLSISKGSFYIYLAHPFAMLIVDKFCRAAGLLNPIVMMMAELIGIVIIVYPLALLYVVKIKPAFSNFRLKTN